MQFKSVKSEKEFTYLGRRWLVSLAKINGVRPKGMIEILKGKLEKRW